MEKNMQHHPISCIPYLLCFLTVMVLYDDLWFLFDKFNNLPFLYRLPVYWFLSILTLASILCYLIKKNN